MSTNLPGAAALVCLVLSAAACDDDMKDSDVSGAAEEGARDAPGASVGADQIPPMGADAIEAWLARGDYLSWHCEPKPHMFRAPSPHGYNRICSNDAIADNVTGSADWPKGAAAVKELYASAEGSEPIGYAVYLKTDDDSAGGANWYWYERVPLDHAAPHDQAGVVADGMGVGDTPAKKICVGCHVFAGTDATHSPSEGGRDQVYTPVR